MSQMKTSILLLPAFLPQYLRSTLRLTVSVDAPLSLSPHRLHPTNLDTFTDREEFLQYYRQPVTYAEAVYLPARRLAHIRRNIKFRPNRIPRPQTPESEHALQHSCFCCLPYCKYHT
jgi:hypothetical protein